MDKKLLKIDEICIEMMFRLSRIKVEKPKCYKIPTHREIGFFGISR